MINKKRRWSLLTCCIGTALITSVTILAIGFMALRNLTGDVYDTARFLRALHIIKNHYYGDVTSKQLLDGSIKGMVEAADDPYTVYLGNKELRYFNDVTKGSFGGIGIVFGKRGNDFVVISALEDNPGAKAGIKSGDIITAVDKETTSNMNMEQLADKIRGPIGTSIELELKDKNNNLRSVKLMREEVKITLVSGMMLPQSKIGYIYISAFSEGTDTEFTKIYHQLEAEGMEALILDLRGNPGGILSICVNVAKMLVPKGPIVSVVYGNGEKIVENSSLEHVKYPLAVLVDHGSASAAEIVSGAVKDTKAGKLFGVKTFGKGSVQTVYNLDTETAIKVTIAKYYTPSGKSIHGVGIEPDVLVEKKDSDTKDEQLSAAKEYLLEVLQQK